MKKNLRMLLMLILAMAMIFTFVGCGGGDTSGGNDGGDGETKIDASTAVDKALKEAAEENSFSIEAVDYFYKTNFGLTTEDFAPDYDWMTKEYYTYGDSPDAYYGHASITYTCKDGEISDETYNAWVKAAFDKTASIAQDGYNICGWDYIGDNTDPLTERTLEEAMDSWMPGWCFRYGDKFWNVSVGMDYDNDKDSATPGRLYYDGVELDISAGLEKSFDELWSDLEDYVEENEDEIKDAIEDYMEE